MTAHDGRDGRASGAAGPGTVGGGLRCDFCGELVSTVRRVALDRGYDRLRMAHRELYACLACSERKERARLGLGPGPGPIRPRVDPPPRVS